MKRWIQQFVSPSCRRPATEGMVETHYDHHADSSNFRSSRGSAGKASWRVKRRSEGTKKTDEGEEEEEEEKHAPTRASETASHSLIKRSLSSSSSSSSVSAALYDGRKMQLLDTIAKVQRQYLQSEGPKVTFGCLLEALLNLMESEYGFIGEIKHEKDEETGEQITYVQTQAVTNIAWNAATRAFYEENKESGLKFYNLNTLFGKVVTTEEPVISNNPRQETPGTGIPDGHPHLNCFLGIPFFRKGGEINGLMCIANKPGGYDQEDIDFLEPFTVTCGNLIHGYWQMERNKELIGGLEERTRELETLNTSLEEANQRVVQASAAQLQHFACMSHELRTPLNCIIGLSSMLEESDSNTSQRESVKMIVKSGDLLMTVVNDLLDYSKLESGNIEIEIRSTSLQDTLNSVVQSIEVQAQTKHLTIQCYLDPTLPEFIRTDSKRLSQILYNLLGNAVKFSHAHGRIEVWAQLIKNHDNVAGVGETKAKTAVPVCPQDNGSKDDNTQSRCPFAKTTPSSSPPPSQSTKEGASSSACPHTKTCHTLRLKVKDYGKGIARKDHDRIFEPFSQASAETERLYGGTGLGLAITSKLTKALEGSIAVDSELGKWTEFTVDLPCRDDPVDLEEAKERIPPGSKALIVASPDTPHDHTLWHLSQVFGLYGFPYQIVSNMDHLGTCSSKPKHQEQQEEATCLQTEAGADSNVIDPSTRCCNDSNLYICIVHADLYRREAYRERLEDRCKCNCALITFGSSQPCEPEDATTHHVRSLTHVLPSILMSGITQLLRNIGTKVNTSTTTNSSSGKQTSSLSLSSASSSTADNNRKKESLSSALEPSKSVLVAEDNVINQKVLVRMLKRLGINDVDVVDNGLEAVQMEQRKPYDVVLMDMQMPVMDGVEACRNIVRRQEQRHEQHHRVPPVIFVTANVSASSQAECQGAGGSGFLSKPFNIRAIRDVLLSAQEGLSSLTSTTTQCCREKFENRGC